jgi:hypothetical protein
MMIVYIQWLSLFIIHNKLPILYHRFISVSPSENFIIISSHFRLQHGRSITAVKWHGEIHNGWPNPTLILSRLCCALWPLITLHGFDRYSPYLSQSAFSVYDKYACGDCSTFRYYKIIVIVLLVASLALLFNIISSIHLELSNGNKC